MTNRTRKIVLRVPVTPEERELIRQKMALLHTRNFSAYARKMLIDDSLIYYHLIRYRIFVSHCFINFGR